MIRLTLTDDGRLVAHAPLGERDLSPAEAEQIREAIDSPGMPWWVDLGTVLFGIVALLIVARGGGQ